MSVESSFMGAFAKGLAERGITPSMAAEVMGKQASMTKEALGFWGSLGKAPALIASATPVAKTAIGAAFALPAAAAGIAGYTMGQEEGVEPPDIKAMMEEERVNRLRRAIKELTKQQGMR